MFTLGGIKTRMRASKREEPETTLEGWVERTSSVSKLWDQWWRLLKVY